MEMFALQSKSGSSMRKLNPEIMMECDTKAEMWSRLKLMIFFLLTRKKTCIHHLVSCYDYFF